MDEFKKFDSVEIAIVSGKNIENNFTYIYIRGVLIYYFESKYFFQDKFYTNVSLAIKEKGIYVKRNYANRIRIRPCRIVLFEKYIYKMLIFFRNKVILKD